jgi:M6 family metalloprotease-like protein
MNRFLIFFSLLFVVNVFAAETLDIRVLRVEFLYEETNNSLTTGRGTFNSDPKDYKLDPKGERHSEAYWQNHIEFAENYFEKASGGKVKIKAEVYPKKQDAYKLQKHIIDYNRTNRKKGEKMEAFDSARAADYARFVNDVLNLAKADTDAPLDAPSFGKRVILIAHAGSNRLVDGGTLGTRGANTPGDFMDAYIDTTWGEFWQGFEVSPDDTIKSVMVTSETASQDGLNWGINGTIISQIGRELGLPYSFDVVKGFSRLGYFDGMDFAGYNAGNGFFPSLPSAWMRAYNGWAEPKEISPSINKDTVEICAAGHYNECGSTPQIIKIPINNNEYILLENRQRTSSGKISVKMDNGQIATIPVDSLYSNFLDSATQKYKGVITSIDEIDAALPASGIAAWHVNKWYVDSLVSYGAINAWNGNAFRDHQFGIAMIEADGVLGLGKEFKNTSGESVFYFGSGSDLIPHKKFNGKKQFDTVFSINPVGYANTASTFGGYSGIKITAMIPPNDKQEKTFNSFTGDSVITWQALKISVVIEWVGKYAQPITKGELPSYISIPTEDDFANSKVADFSRIGVDIDGDGFADSIFLGNNRLHVVDRNNVPLPNFPVILSNGEPFTYFHSKPLVIDITGKDSLAILIPANNGLILAVNSKGKLQQNEFPLAAGTFEYDNPDTLLLHVSSDFRYLFAKHRDSISIFHLPLAKEFLPKRKEATSEDKIEEFFIFPNPIRNGKASMRFRILNPASSAALDIFDITGFKVFSKNISNVNHGSNQIEGLDFSKLGSDVYSARLTVKFTSGKKKEKWFRIGVVR